MTRQANRQTALTALAAMVVVWTATSGGLPWLFGLILAVLLGVVAVSSLLGSDIRDWWYRNPKVPDGWKLEVQPSKALHGVFRTLVRIERVSTDALPPGKVTILCSRSVRHAEFRIKTLSGARNPAFLIKPEVLGDGVVVLFLRAPSTDPFCFTGHVESAESLTVDRLRYDPGL